MQHWIRALRGLITGTEPLHAAAALDAASSAHSSYCSPNPALQEEMLRECLLQIVELESELEEYESGSTATSSGSGDAGDGDGGRRACTQPSDAGGAESSQGPSGGAGSTHSGASTWAEHLFSGGRGADEVLRQLQRVTPEGFAQRAHDFVQAAAVDLFQ